MRSSVVTQTEQRIFESPKMPLISDPKAANHLYQISGKSLLSPLKPDSKDQTFKLPAIKPSLTEVEEIGDEIQDNLTWKNQKQDL